MKNAFVTGLAAFGMTLVSPASAADVTALEILNSLPDDERALVSLELVFNGIPQERLAEIVFRQDDASGEIEVDAAVPGAPAPLNRAQTLYLGVRLGLPFLFGIDATYFNYSADGKVRFQLTAELSTSILIAEGSVGVGIHPGGRAFYLGGRVYQLWGLNIFGSPENGSYLGAGQAVGLELGWTKSVGRNGRVQFMARAGMMLLLNSSGEQRLFPDFAAGFRVGLGR